MLHKLAAHNPTHRSRRFQAARALESYDVWVRGCASTEGGARSGLTAPGLNMSNFNNFSLLKIPQTKPNDILLACSALHRPDFSFSTLSSHFK